MVRMRFDRLIPALALVAGCEGGLYTDAEWERLETLVNVDEDPPADPVNKYVGDPNAEALGQMLFFDTRLSGVVTGRDVLSRPISATRAPVGEPVEIACATCHDPARGGVDHSSVPGHVSIGAGIYDVNAQSVINAAYYDLKYWNGRYDSLVWQALAVMESGVSMNTSRVRIAWLLSDLYQDEYEAAFPEYPLPSFGGTFEAQAARLQADGQCTLVGSACPSDCVEQQGGCWPRWPLEGRPGDGECNRGDAPLDDSFDCMDPDDQELITRTFVNVAKALAAYEYRLVSRNSPFDRFVLEGPDSDLISPSAKRGAKLFVGKASCIDCHDGPLLTDESFHNVGVPQVGAGVPTEADCPPGGSCDCAGDGTCPPWGAHYGLTILQRTTRRADNPTYSDDPRLTEGSRPWYEREITDDLKGAWRTPSLRHVAATGPYMHNGYYASLEEVIRHYDRGGTRFGAASGQLDKRIRPIGLSDGEIQDLVDFLKSLTGEPLPSELVTSPPLP